jgi:two-component system response regulator FlrC
VTLFCVTAGCPALPSGEAVETVHFSEDERDGPLCRRLARAAAALPPAPEPVAADPASRALLGLARRAAAADVTILVTGPSGAGKDVVARYIHAKSGRARGPFVAVNCAALPEAMLEALLFGHERGAFTGALQAAPGLFRAADGGTLFLDEVGELPLAMQAKLLRAVEQREVLPLGATRAVAVDVRLVAATNRDLASAVAEGRFRADLHWRLSVFPLALKPLAERRDDILPLVARWQASEGAELRFTEAALARLLAHGWPGNVRELGNVLARACILAADGVIDTGAILIDGERPACPRLDGLGGAVKAREEETIRAALASSGGRRTEAARQLGISERTLRYKLAAYAGRPRRPATVRGTLQ